MKIQNDAARICCSPNFLVRFEIAVYNAEDLYVWRDLLPDALPLDRSKHISRTTSRYDPQPGLTDQTRIKLLIK